MSDSTAGDIEVARQKLLEIASKLKDRHSYDSDGMKLGNRTLGQDAAESIKPIWQACLNRQYFPNWLDIVMPELRNQLDGGRVAEDADPAIVVWEELPVTAETEFVEYREVTKYEHEMTEEELRAFYVRQARSWAELIERAVEQLTPKERVFLSILSRIEPGGEFRTVEEASKHAAKIAGLAKVPTSQDRTRIRDKYPDVSMPEWPRGRRGKQSKKG